MPISKNSDDDIQQDNLPPSTALTAALKRLPAWINNLIANRKLDQPLLPDKQLTYVLSRLKNEWELYFYYRRELRSRRNNKPPRCFLVKGQASEHVPENVFRALRDRHIVKLVRNRPNYSVWAENERSCWRT